MINPLAIATRGRISTSIKRTLTIATLGLIVITGSASGSDPVYVRRKVGGGNITFVIPNQRLLLADEHEVMEIIKAFTECQK